MTRNIRFRKPLAVSASLALAASALLVTSPAAFASTIKLTAPGLQGFSAIPGSWFLLNEPDEFIVTPSTAVPAPTSQSSTTTTQQTKIGWKYISSGFSQSYQYWQSTSHWQSYQYWVASGYTATATRWVRGYSFVGAHTWWSHNVWHAYAKPWTTAYCHENQSGLWNDHLRKRVNAVGTAGCWYNGTWEPNGTWLTGFLYYSYVHHTGYWATVNEYIPIVTHVPGHWQSYQYWQSTSHWQSYQYWVASGYTATATRWVNTSHWLSYTYQVPIVTTTADTGISIAKETLVGVQPIIQDTTPGTYYGQEWYGTFCYGGQTPLIGPTLPGGATNPAFPNFSGRLYKYTYFFEQQHICTFNPTYVASNNVQSWWLAGNTARMVLIPQYSVT
ncbi:MAG: hypothetical protein ACYDHP_13515, partial [Ferrimicrobium sp.]